MSDFMKLFRREKSGEGIHVRREPAYTGAVGRKTLEDIFDGCSDFQSREIRPRTCRGQAAFCMLA